MAIVILTQEELAQHTEKLNRFIADGMVAMSKLDQETPIEEVSPWMALFLEMQADGRL